MIEYNTKWIHRNIMCLNSMHTKLACNWEVVKQKRTRLQGSTSLASVSSNSRVCWFADATGVEFHFIPGDRYTLDKLTVYFYPTTSINRVGRCQNSKLNGIEKVKKWDVKCQTNESLKSIVKKMCGSPAWIEPRWSAPGRKCFWHLLDFPNYSKNIFAELF